MLEKPELGKVSVEILLTPPPLEVKSATMYPEIIGLLCYFEMCESFLVPS